MWNEFHFLQPLWLLLFPLLLVLSYLWLRVRNTRQHWSEVCDPELLPFLVKESQTVSRRAPILAVMVSLLLAIAAAQPVWEKQPQPAFKQGGAVVIAWDLSASMNATDIKPSRLQRSRFKIEDLLTKLADSQVALLVYAGDAFVVTPLTEDVDTIHAQLPAMVPEIMPAQGGRADKALKLAGDMLKQAGVQGGDILLVSDEVEPAQVAAEASRLRQQGRQVSILAVGTEQGAPVPTESGLLKDRQGNVVLARTHIALMREAASLGGGQAVRLSNNDTDLTQLLSGFDQGKKVLTQPGSEVEHWVAQGPWVVLLALPLLLPLFRRGILQLMLPVLCLGALVQVPDAEAGVWQDLWQSKDQQAAQTYASGDKATAAQLFSDTRWKQVAHYENDDYDAALNSQPEPETAADWYNRGNVLARLGQLDEAIAAFDQALAQQADHEDAAYNKKLLEDLKQQQEQQQNPQQNPQGEQQDKQDAKQDQSDKQSQSDDKKQAQSSQNQDNQDQQQSEQNQQGDQSDQQQSSQQQNPQDSAESEDNPSAAENAKDKQPDATEQQQTADYLKQQLDKRQQEKKTEGESHAAQAVQQAPVDEAEQARQQLLNRIVDDPAGLWRRKFIYQYRQRAQQNSAEEKSW